MPGHDVSRYVPDVAIGTLKKTSKPKDIPPFLRKLYHMVDETETNNCISWNETGDGFILINAEIFARDVLPRYFKHNNFATFVRQLNMYDFSKVGLVDRGVVSVGEFHAWQFTHPYFVRGRPDLVANIHRKTYVPITERKGKSDRQLDELVQQFKQVQLENHDMHEALVQLKQESEDLRRQNRVLIQNSQLSLARTTELHGTVEKIIKFLASVYTPEFIRDQLSVQPALMSQISPGGQNCQPNLSYNQGRSVGQNFISTGGVAIPTPNNQLVPVYSYPTIGAMRLAASRGASVSQLNNRGFSITGSLASELAANHNSVSTISSNIEVLEEGCAPGQGQTPMTGFGSPTTYSQSMQASADPKGIDLDLDLDLDVSGLPDIMSDQMDQSTQASATGDEPHTSPDNTIMGLFSPSALDSFSHSASPMSALSPIDGTGLESPLASCQPAAPATT